MHRLQTETTTHDKANRTGLQKNSIMIMHRTLQTLVAILLAICCNCSSLVSLDVLTRPAISLSDVRDEVEHQKSPYNYPRVSCKCDKLTRISLL